MSAEHASQQQVKAISAEARASLTTLLQLLPLQDLTATALLAWPCIRKMEAPLAL